jgi:hypothetical protein
VKTTVPASGEQGNEDFAAGRGAQIAPDTGFPVRGRADGGDGKD